MTYRTRTLLFLGAIAAFAILGYITVLYAQGYKYSFDEKRFFRTGAIALSANRDAKVFIDDELKGTTSFIGSSFSEDGLLPGRYTVRLQQDGFSSWQKEVTVQEGQVTDFPEVLLLPTDEESMAPIASEAALALKAPTVILAPTKAKTPSAVHESFFIQDKVLYRGAPPIAGAERIASNVLGFAFPDGNGRIAFWTQHELWVIWLRDNGGQPLKKAGDKELIMRFTSSITRAAWYPDRFHLIVDAGGLRVVEIDTRGGVNAIRL